VKDDTVGQGWDGGSFYKCSEEMLHYVFFSVCCKVLYIVWVVYLSLSDQHYQGVPLSDSLLTEKQIKVQRSHRAVLGSQYHLDKGAWCDPRTFAYVFQQNGWGELVQVRAWEGEVLPHYHNLLFQYLPGPSFLWDHHCVPSRGQWFLNSFSHGSCGPNHGQRSYSSGFCS